PLAAQGANGPYDVRKQALERALAAEKQGDWLEACRWYDEVLRRYRTHADSRRGYQRCLRRHHLVSRHRDPHYQQVLARLTPSQALDLYEQVLAIVTAAYVDRNKISLAALFQEGVRELRFALEEDVFLREHLPGVNSGAAALRTFKA